MKKRTKYARTHEHTLFVQDVSSTKKNGVWKQKGIIEQEISFLGSRFDDQVIVDPKPKKRDLDLEKFKEDYNV